jgi:hypothetical protein
MGALNPEELVVDRGTWKHDRISLVESPIREVDEALMLRAAMPAQAPFAVEPMIGDVENGFGVYSDAVVTIISIVVRRDGKEVCRWKLC